jgi:ribonuclease P protein component
MKKKIGTAVKRNRIKRKLRGIVQKLLKIERTNNLNYTYIVLGKAKFYKKHCNSLYEKMEKNFKKLENLNL